MTCRQCGAEIADKALICYRCGTATTEAKYQPPPIRSARSSGPGGMRMVWIVLVVLALLMAAAYFLRHVG